MNWTKTAYLFPGQGSQIVGMGKDFADTYPIARETFEEADEILGFALSRLMFEGPEAELNDTINTQPALYVHSMAALRALKQALPDAAPAFAAGHSLGEVTALAAVGAMSFADGLRLVRERGRLMKHAGDVRPGGMAAVLGLEREAVEEICQQTSEQTGQVVIMANDNCPGQIVISGEQQALNQAVELAKARGARRALPLAVSIAAHSPVMAVVANEFAQAVAQVTIQMPETSVYGNIHASPLDTPGAIREELTRQLTNPVNWTRSIRAMIADGAETFVEIGPRSVLTGLLKRIDRQRTGVNIDTREALEDFVS